MDGKRGWKEGEKGGGGECTYWRRSIRRDSVGAFGEEMEVVGDALGGEGRVELFEEADPAVEERVGVVVV